jgi:hypothetical protein
MPRPSVQIFQQVLNTTVVPADPEQATCIVGPAYAFFNASSDSASHAGYSWSNSDNDISLSHYGWTAGTHELDVDTGSTYYPSIVASSMKILRGSASDGACADGLTVTGTFAPSGPAVGNRLRIKGTLLQQLVLDADWLAQTGYTPAVGDSITSDLDGNGNVAYRVVALTSEGVLLEDNTAKLIALRPSAVPAKKPIAVVTRAGDGYSSGADAVAQLGAPASDYFEEVTVRSVTGGIKSASPIFTLGATFAADPNNNLAEEVHELAIDVISDLAGTATLVPSSANATTGAVTIPRTNGVVVIATSSGNQTLASATVHVSWRGVINNLPDIYEISSIPENSIFPDIGKIDPRNPLAMGVACAVSNSGNTKIKVLPISADTAAGYVGALNKLNSATDVYAIIPMSTDISGVIAPYKAAAEAMSQPAKSRWRIVIGASSGAPEFAFVGPSTGAETETGVTTGNSKVLTDADATFVVSKVVAGDKVVKSDGTVIGTVASVESDVQLTLVANAANGAGQTISYTVQRSISGNTGLQVAELKARIKSLASKRLVMLYPGSCTAMGFSGQPGTYIAAALGGLMAGTPSHQPLNQVGLGAISQIFDSNLLFSDSEIDDLGDNGYFVLVQDSLTGAPYTVHQVTTGQISMPGVQEFSEVSVVSNFDFVASSLKKRLDPYVGVWNVIPEAIASISSSLEGGLDDLRTRSRPRIGSPLVSGAVLSVQKNAADAGRLDVSVEVEIPKVLNKLVVYLTSI